jgi:hypothetical protein
MWEKFAPEDKYAPELIDTDFFSDPTKPGVLATSALNGRAPISIPLPDTALKRRRPIAEDWFISDAYDPSQAFEALQPPAALPAALLRQPTTLQPSALQPPVLQPPSVLQPPFITLPRQPSTAPLSQRSPPRQATPAAHRPCCTSSGQTPAAHGQYPAAEPCSTPPRPPAPVLNSPRVKSESPTITVSSGLRSQSDNVASSRARSDSLTELDNNAFWPGTPPPRDPLPTRAAKRICSYQEISDDDLYDASPPHLERRGLPVPANDVRLYLIEASPEQESEQESEPDYTPKGTEDEDELGDWQQLMHPELRRETPFSESENFTKESSE